MKPEAGGECRVLRHLDWQTTVWYERDRYPRPLADRESLFCVHWQVSDAGRHVCIVQCPIELRSHPVATIPVRTSTFIVHEMRVAGEDTEWSICLEFNAGGSLPTKLVSNYIASQAKTFGQLSAYIGTDPGTARKNAWDRKLCIMARDPTHPLHAIRKFGRYGTSKNAGLRAIVTLVTADFRVL